MDPINTATASAQYAFAGARGNADLGRDEFLQLLVAQLKNQDPTSPQDSSAFAAQLAQFSSVEQLTNINGALSGQTKQLTQLAQAIGQAQAGQAAQTDQLAGRVDLQAASSLIGQTVQVRSGAVEWTGDGPAPLTVHLGGDVREVEVTLRNAKGDVVRVLRAGALPAGDHALDWDGAATDGAPAPAGTYTATVSAIGADGTPVDAAPAVSGRVDRVTVEGDGVFVWIGGRRLPFEALLAIGGASAEAPTTKARPDARPADRGFLPL